MIRALQAGTVCSKDRNPVLVYYTSQNQSAFIAKWSEAPAGLRVPVTGRMNAGRETVSPPINKFNLCGCSDCSHQRGKKILSEMSWSYFFFSILSCARQTRAEEQMFRVNQRMGLQGEIISHSVIKTTKHSLVQVPNFPLFMVDFLPRRCISVLH